MSSNSNRRSQAQTTHVWRKLIVRIVLIVAALAAMAFLGSRMSEAGAVEATRDNSAVTVDRIEEDDPRWDCRTMGNQRCGEGAAVNGAPVEAGDYSRDAQQGAWLYPAAAATIDNPFYMPIVAIPADDEATAEGVDALLAAGYVGDPTDHAETLYAPENLVINVPGGTWTVTMDGLRQCVDFDTTGAECSGTEFLA